MSWISDVASGLGSLAGSFIGIEQAKDQASKTRAMQKVGSNTAYQRAAKDLEKAGLNRLLALGSPASTPGGAQANLPDVGNTMGRAATTALQMASAASQRGIAKQNKAKGELYDEMLTEYRRSPESVKRLSNIGMLANTVGVRPELFIAGHSAKGFWDRTKEFWTNPGNWGRAGELYKDRKSGKRFKSYGTGKHRIRIEEH